MCRAPGVASKWHIMSEVLKREGDTKMFPRLEVDQAAERGGGMGRRVRAGSQPG